MHLWLIPEINAETVLFWDILYPQWPQNNGFLSTCYSFTQKNMSKLKKSMDSGIRLSYKPLQQTQAQS